MLGWRSRYALLRTRNSMGELLSNTSILGCQAAADTCIAISLVFVLRQQRTGYASYVQGIAGAFLPWSLTPASRPVVVLRTDTVLNWIILYGIATGAITSIVAIVLLICVSISSSYLIGLDASDWPLLATVCRGRSIRITTTHRNGESDRHVLLVYSVTHWSLIWQPLGGIYISALLAKCVSTVSA